MGRTASITLSETTYEVTQLRVKGLKKLARFVMEILRDFQEMVRLSSDDEALAMFDKLLEKPEEFMERLAPAVPASAVEDAYLDELVDAVQVLWALQGFDKLKELASPFQQIMTFQTGEVSEETLAAGTASMQSSSSTSDDPPTDTPSTKSSEDSSSSDEG